jgi:hypothetical protein
MYSHTCDYMLDLLDSVPPEFTECAEGLVAMAATYLMSFLSARHVEATDMGTIAQTCLCIASKFVERIQLPFSIMAEDADAAFDPAAFKALELHILETIGWKLRATTPYSLREFVIGIVARATTVSDDNLERVRSLMNVYLYMGFREPCYLELSDQNVLLAAAVEAACQKVLQPAEANGVMQLVHRELQLHEQRPAVQHMLDVITAVPRATTPPAIADGEARTAHAPTAAAGSLSGKAAVDDDDCDSDDSASRRSPTNIEANLNALSAR